MGGAVSYAQVPGQPVPPTLRRGGQDYDWRAHGWVRRGATAYARSDPDQLIARHVSAGVPYYEAWHGQTCIGRYPRADQAVWAADYVRAAAREEEK